MNFACHIQCYFNNSKQNIAEQGQFICQQMTINATQSSYLSVNVTIGNVSHLPYPRTMESAAIYCPTRGHEPVKYIMTAMISCDF